ncbi:MAG: hypothetical protein AB7F94_09230 [Nitrospira sp.]
MLKITEERGAESGSLSLILEGRLSGLWVEELKTYCRVVAENRQRRTMIDLTSVTFIDADGKALLARLWRDGAELRASGCLTRCVIEDITGGSRSDPSCKKDDKFASPETQDET